MKYYVISDTHGFYTEVSETLKKKGWFDDHGEKRLVICGDLMDRGEEAVKMQNFVKSVKDAGELIYIRGNHEFLMQNMMSNFEENLWEIIAGGSHHIQNGTFSTALQISKMYIGDAFRNADDFIKCVKQSAYYSELIPSAINFYETSKYIFVHGWIPVFAKSNAAWYKGYKYDANWRTSPQEKWDDAIWLNGMDMACEYNIIEPEKTIICGHWHTSYGHAKFEGKGQEYSKTADFSPFYSNGIIAMDGCTALTGHANCIVIEDD